MAELVIITATDMQEVVEDSRLHVGASSTSILRLSMVLETHVLRLAYFITCICTRTNEAQCSVFRHIYLR